MERHRCKLCSKNFSNGRALGCHMNKSHLLTLPISEQMPQVHETHQKFNYHITESASSASSSSSSEEEEEDGEVKDQGYGLRENPKKSVRLADPEFSFVGSVVLQDRESETESSKNPTTRTRRRRSKRVRKSSPVFSSSRLIDAKRKIKLGEFCNRVVESSFRVDPEPVSSSVVSDATTEEDVAFCLMMLSRDKWKRQRQRKEEEVAKLVAKLDGDEDLEMEEEEEEEDEEEEEEEETDESEELENCSAFFSNNNNKNNKNRGGGRYSCETCKKTFRSYQALGGHRASHKKAQLLLPRPPAVHVAAPQPITAKCQPPVKVHECPYCSRVFSSGQALGGHKRSHTTTSYGTTVTVPAPVKKSGEALIDLNLPAPVDDDDIIELSAVLSRT